MVFGDSPKRSPTCSAVSNFESGSSFILVPPNTSQGDAYESMVRHTQDTPPRVREESE